MCHLLLSLSLFSFSKLELFEESERTQEVALRILTKLYGRKSDEVAGVLTNLGMTYSELKKFQYSRFAIPYLRLGCLLCQNVGAR